MLATETELAPNTLLTFIVGLGKLYPSRRKICGGWTWRGPPPQLPPLHHSSTLWVPSPLNLFVVSVHSPCRSCAWCLWLFKTYSLCFPSFASEFHPKFCPFLIPPRFHPNPLLWRCYINLTPVRAPLFFARSSAIFCYAWKMHLACGNPGSDGYISPGGSLASGDWLVSPVRSGPCACWCRLFHWHEPVDFGVPTGVHQSSHPAGRNPGAPVCLHGVILPDNYQGLQSSSVL